MQAVLLNSGDEFGDLAGLIEGLATNDWLCVIMTTCENLPTLLGVREVVSSNLAVPTI